MSLQDGRCRTCSCFRPESVGVNNPEGNRGVCTSVYQIANRGYDNPIPRNKGNSCGSYVSIDIDSVSIFVNQMRREYPDMPSTDVENHVLAVMQRVGNNSHITSRCVMVWAFEEFQRISELKTQRQDKETALKESGNLKSKTNPEKEKPRSNYKYGFENDPSENWFFVATQKDQG